MRAIASALVSFVPVFFVAFPCLAQANAKDSLASPDSASLDGAAESSLEQYTDDTGDEDETYGAVARIEAPTTEVTERTITASDARQQAGASGDVLRAIEALPGVTRGGGTGGAPLLRGASWNESLVLLDGTPIPLLYHFGGIKSVYNSLLIERVEAIPSTFGARYGRVVGGVINVVPREPRLDGVHAAVDLSFLDSTAMVEGPVSDQSGVALAARRSNIDLVFSQLAGESDFKTVAAPLYWDYQGIARVPLGRHHRLEALSYGARDGLKLLFTEPSTDDPSIRGNLEAALEAHRLGWVLNSDFDGGVEQRLALFLGRETGTYSVASSERHYRMDELFFRGDWTVPLTSTLTSRFGIDHKSMYITGSYDGPAVPQAEGDVEGATPDSIQETVHFVGNMTRHQPAGFVELLWQASSQVTVIPGVRSDYDGGTRYASVDPRLAVRYAVTPETTVNWGVGTYTQPPEYYEILPGVGNPKVDPFRALHVSAGVEQRVGQVLELGVDGFAKRVVHRIVSTTDGEPPGLVNDGVGRILGAELWGTLHLERTSATLAYTFTSSQRRDRNEAWRRSDSEQPHVLVATAEQKLGRGWTLGARLRLESGTPVTPVEGSIYDASIGQYRPVFGKPFSERNPMQQQLDLRIAKTWSIGPAKLSAYADVQNLTDAENPEGFSYSFDYTRKEAVSGMPIFPNLGISGEI